MLLIRGYNQECYAREMDSGIIGFHDLLTTLLYPENNGYKLSDYYEEHLVKAVVNHDFLRTYLGPINHRLRMQLNLIFDLFIPYFYMTYFHILNEKSIDWVKNNFDDNAHFVFAVPRLQKTEDLDEIAYGKNMIGSRMHYIAPQDAARSPEALIRKAGIVTLLQNELDASKGYGGTPIDAAIYAQNIIICICLEAFARRCAGKYLEDENEFRIIYKIPTPYRQNVDCFLPEKEREYSVQINNVAYKGNVIRDIVPSPIGTLRYDNMLLATNNPLIQSNITNLLDEVDCGNSFTIQPQFLSVNMRSIFSEYGYIGTKNDCLHFIQSKKERFITNIRYI